MKLNRILKLAATAITAVPGLLFASLDSVTPPTYPAGITSDLTVKATADSRSGTWEVRVVSMPSAWTIDNGAWPVPANNVQQTLLPYQQGSFVFKATPGTSAQNGSACFELWYDRGLLGGGWTLVEVRCFSIAIQDTSGPVLSNWQVSNDNLGWLTVSASITDPSGIAAAALKYDVNPWLPGLPMYELHTPVAMSGPSGGGTFTARLPGTFNNSDAVYLRVETRDSSPSNNLTVADYPGNPKIISGVGQGLPIIQSVSVSKTNVAPGEVFQVTVRAQNSSAVADYLDIQVVDKTTPGWLIITSPMLNCYFAPGQIRDLVFQVCANSSGTHTLWAQVRLTGHALWDGPERESPAVAAPSDPEAPTISGKSLQWSCNRLDATASVSDYGSGVREVRLWYKDPDNFLDFGTEVAMTRTSGSSASGSYSRTISPWTPGRVQYSIRAWDNANNLRDTGYYFSTKPVPTITSLSAALPPWSSTVPVTVQVRNGGSDPAAFDIRVIDNTAANPWPTITANKLNQVFNPGETRTFTFELSPVSGGTHTVCAQAGLAGCAAWNQAEQCFDLLNGCPQPIEIVTGPTLPGPVCAGSAVSANWLLRNHCNVSTCFVAQVRVTSPVGTVSTVSSSYLCLAPGQTSLFGGTFNLPMVGTYTLCLRISDGGFPFPMPLLQDCKEIVARSCTPSRFTESRHTNGVFYAKLTGDPGATCVIEASTNLFEWVSVSTNQLSAGGTLEFAHPQSGELGRQFYRAVSH